MGTAFARELNPEQLRAVQSVDGAVLILAGAGSGKTRVITYRIAYLLGRGAPQSAILAVTFTNKAAREMAERVRQLHGRRLPRLTVCTFHAFGVRILREYGDRLGFRPNFSIYDETDRQALIKDVAREVGMIRSGGEPLDVYRISGLFSRLKSQVEPWREEDEPFRRLFQEYQRHLRLHNAVDFDDLIRLPLELWDSEPDTLAALRDRFRYLMVDEFQDTSTQQYRLIRQLAGERGNICVVGDDDQSIYSWRGANFENLRRFEEDFPALTEITLEQNYRSTGAILLTANGLIARNANRKPKRLWSSLGQGEPVRVSYPEDEVAEAQEIAESIRTLSLRERLPLSNFGVLVRANSLTRPIEEALIREGIPYQVSGGTSFFQRREVKDVVSYLKVLANPDDDVNLVRILNRPRRGIGPRTLETMVETARRRGCSLYSALAALRHASDTPLPDRTVAAVDEFLSMVEEYRSRLLSGRQMAASLRALVEALDYWGYLVQENSQPNVARWKFGNVEGMVDSLAAYESDPDNLNPSLYDYLNRISLITRDDDQGREERGKVNVMTIHAAKGLEFEVVFIAGVEQDLLPHARSIEEGEANLEEERRLFYVAITRARRRLHLSACRTRRRRGQLREAAPSAFLEELPQELLEIREAEEALSAGEAREMFERMRQRFR